MPGRWKSTDCRAAIRADGGGGGGDLGIWEGVYGDSRLDGSSGCLNCLGGVMGYEDPAGLACEGEE